MRQCSLTSASYYALKGYPRGNWTMKISALANLERISVELNLMFYELYDIFIKLFKGFKKFKGDS